MTEQPAADPYLEGIMKKISEQPSAVPEAWMLHDMEFATVVTVQKPGKFIALCDGKSFTPEENLAHAELIIADHGAADERDRLVAVLDVATTFLKCIVMECPAHLNFGDRAKAVLDHYRVSAVLAEAHKPETAGAGG